MDGQKHARESLVYFEQYIQGIRGEPQKLADAQEMITSRYERYMPQLKPEIAALKQRNFQ